MKNLWSDITEGPAAVPTVIELLRPLPVCTRLNGRDLKRLAHILYRRSYEPGEVVFRQGEPGVGMYIIQEGGISIRHEPTNAELAHLGTGAFFGEIALLNDTPRSASAVATKPTTLFGLFRPELLDLVERRPRLGVRLLLSLAQVAGQRLIEANEEMEAMALHLHDLEKQQPEAGHDR